MERQLPVGTPVQQRRWRRDSAAPHGSAGGPGDGYPRCADLLAAGAGVDVVGLRSWQLPSDLLAAVMEQHPRLGFKGEFTAACRTEAARVPRGRVQFLRRYGAFDLAIRLAPFRG